MLALEIRKCRDEWVDRSDLIWIVRANLCLGGFSHGASTIEIANEDGGNGRTDIYTVPKACTQ